MSIYYKRISAEDFNDKYKNRLRDFYIYQFKKKSEYYKTKQSSGKKKDSVTNDNSKELSDAIDYNKTICGATVQSDSQRLQQLISEDMRVTWIGSKKAKKCISLDSRAFNENPFLKLYRTCGRRSEHEGSDFAFTYLIVMFLYSVNGVFAFEEWENNYDFSIKHKNLLINTIKEKICEAYADEKHYNRVISYDDIPLSDKRRLFAIIDRKIIKSLNSLTSDFDSGLDEIYESMFYLRRRLFMNAEGEFEVRECTPPFSFKMLQDVVMDTAPLDIDIIKEKQFRNRLGELCDLGILACSKLGYRLSDVRLDIKDEDFRYRFAQMIHFFTNVYPLGSIGSYIMRRIGDVDKVISFKHNYLIHSLNDYNIIDILYAIENEKWLKIEYRSGKPKGGKYREIIVYPIEIRESTFDGRQNLICYNPVFHNVSSLRIEFIDSITIGSLVESEEYIDKELSIAKKRIEYTWGTSFPALDRGNATHDPEDDSIDARGLHRVEILIKYDEKKEEFIYRRIKRELDKDKKYVELVDPYYKSTKYGNCIKIVVNVTDAYEVIKWTRTFTVRVISLKVDGAVYDVYNSDINAIYKKYCSKNKNIKPVTESKLETAIIPPIRNEVKFVSEEKSLHKYLFNEFFSEHMEALGELLFKTIFARTSPFKPEEKEKVIKEYVNKYLGDLASGIGETDIKSFANQIDYFIQYFVCNENKIAVDRNRLPNSIFNIFPLTKIEIQWLHNVLMDEKAKLFLEQDEIDALLEMYSEISLSDENPKPLFRFEHIIYHNQFNDVSSLYKNSIVKSALQEILKANRDQKKVKIEYIRNGTTYSDIYSPISIEYSKKDDIFRIYTVCNNQVFILNLERILSCEIVNERFHIYEYRQLVENYINFHLNMIKVRFIDTKDVPDRILNEFAPWKKECILDTKTQTYTMTLWYDDMDATEIVIRLLGYGKNVFIESDDSDTDNIRTKLISRLETQLDIWRNPVIIKEVSDEGIR